MFFVYSVNFVEYANSVLPSEYRVYITYENEENEEYHGVDFTVVLPSNMEVNAKNIATIFNLKKEDGCELTANEYNIEFCI